MRLDIAVIGAGPVGESLASGLTTQGHRVDVGVRQPADAKYDELRRSVSVVGIADAVRGARVIVLAVPAASLAEAVSGLEFEDRQVVIDATNAVFSPVPDGFVSVGDFVASLLPDQVSYAKAFNTIGAEHLAGGSFEQRTFLPIAGDDAAVLVVEPLARGLGFEVAELGGREAVAMVEEHARLWIHLALRKGWGRDLAWTIVRR